MFVTFKKKIKKKSILLWHLAPMSFFCHNQLLIIFSFLAFSFSICVWKFQQIKTLWNTHTILSGTKAIPCPKLLKSTSSSCSGWTSAGGLDMIHVRPSLHWVAAVWLFDQRYAVKQVHLMKRTECEDCFSTMESTVRVAVTNYSFLVCLLLWV